ncbi:putative integral membrane protein [Streptomyces formicae]|uniref:Putative integral membrane protein n=1 Tax=Streptomyces formicae TaxID=1616117 RepID=A0A291Q635_9ACTN|nr:putative integral membrane protein [Streptomyces formicae]
MSPLARCARAEWGHLFSTVRAALVARRWRAVPMTLAAVCLTAAFQYVQNQPWGYQFIQNIGSVRAEEPLWLALLRTPLSLFVPALDLPVWGALAQILLVFGIAEICLGWWRTLVIGYAATLAGTLYARVGIDLGTGNPFGLPASDAQVVDTGPSAAVVGLAVFVCWRYRAYFTAALVSAVMVLEVVVKNNLAGKEHLAAIVAVAVLCAISALRHRRRDTRSGSGSGSGSDPAVDPAVDPASGAAPTDGPGSAKPPITS